MTTYTNKFLQHLSKCFKTRPSAGFGMVELLAGAAIGSVALLGFSEVFQRYQLTQKKVAAVLLSAGAEVDLVLQLENALAPAYQTPAIRAALLAGADGDLSTLSFPLHFAGGSTPIFANGPAVFINADGSPCLAASFSNPACSFSAQLGVQFSEGRHAFSYQINVNPALANVAPLGDSNAFTTYVPSELYQPISLQQCDTAVPSANPVGDVSVRGMNRSTGEVYCIRKPTPCPQGTFPTGIEFINDFALGGRSGGRLSMICATPSRPMVGCGDSDYVLQGFNATASGANGTCVFRTASPQAWPITYRTSKSVTVGRACPKNYYVVPSCPISRQPPIPSSVTCGRYTTSWNESCTKTPDPLVCELRSMPRPGPEICDTASPPVCKPGPPISDCISYYAQTYTYTHYWTPINGGGPQTFDPPPGPRVNITMLNDNTGFKCDLIYPDLPNYYSKYPEGTTTSRPSLKEFNTCNRPAPTWTPAEMTVNFECKLKPPNDRVTDAN